MTVANAQPFRAGDVLDVYTSYSVATGAHVTVASIAANVLTLTATGAPWALGSYVEVAENGLKQAGYTAASPTPIPDAVILQETVEVAFLDGVTFDATAVGVYRGTIDRVKVNGPGLATGSADMTFDQNLKTELPNISFLPRTTGTA